jgi:hypothetical protein
LPPLYLYNQKYYKYYIESIFNPLPAINKVKKYIIKLRQAKPSQAKPSQAKPSQAKPSQAKPSQAKPSQAKPSIIAFFYI